VLLKWPSLTLASLGNLCACKPAFLQGSVHFSLVVEAVGLMCHEISSRPLKTGPRTILHVLAVAPGETFEREQLTISVELRHIIIQ